MKSLLTFVLSIVMFFSPYFMTGPTAPSGSTILSSSSLGTITASHCASAIVVSESSVVATDNLIVTFNGSPVAVTGYVPGAMLSILPYVAAGSIGFNVCNNTASSITPSNITVNWQVLRQQ